MGFACFAAYHKKVANLALKDSESPKDPSEKASTSRTRSTPCCFQEFVELHGHLPRFRSKTAHEANGSQVNLGRTW